MALPPARHGRTITSTEKGCSLRLHSFHVRYCGLDDHGPRGAITWMKSEPETASHSVTGLLGIQVTNGHISIVIKSAPAAHVH